MDIEQKFKEYQDVGMFCVIIFELTMILAFVVPLFAEAFRFRTWKIAAPVFVVLSGIAVLGVKRKRYLDRYPIRTRRTRAWILALELGLIAAGFALTVWRDGWF
jgi:hypothetical protein